MAQVGNKGGFRSVSRIVGELPKLQTPTRERPTPSSGPPFYFCYLWPAYLGAVNGSLGGGAVGLSRSGKSGNPG